MKKIMKVVVVLVLACTLFITASVSASAEAFSAWTTKQEYQYTYQFRAGMDVKPYAAFSTVYVQSNNGAPILAGFVGANAFLYWSTGQLKQTSGRIFNNVSSPTIQVYTSTTSYGTYYASGLVWFYTGNTQNGVPEYNVYHTESTPLQSYYSSKSNSPESIVKLEEIQNQGYSVNAKGETYGSGLCAGIIGEYPDLMSAVGINGKSGYVRFSDINYQPTSIEDAIEHSTNLTETYVPLYDVEGNRIDWFIVSGNISI